MKVNENKVLSYCRVLRYETIKTTEKLFSFSKTWLIHGTKRGKDNQLQSLELPCWIS